jgi:hypothetical protein
VFGGRVGFCMPVMIAASSANKSDELGYFNL